MSAKLLKILLISYLFQAALLSTQKGQNETQQVHARRQRNIVKKWEFETDDQLEYPRGDMAKLDQISKLWSDHYACLSRVARRVTSSGRLPAVYKTALEGAVVTLPCSLCVAPGEKNDVRWLWGKSLESAFEPIVPEYRVVEQKNGDLSIYGVRTEDSGVYKCVLGHSAGGLVLMEVVEAGEGYNVVKQGEIEETTQMDEKYVMLQSTLQLFAAFPGGVPCRSRYLPDSIRMLPTVGLRRDEILLGLCKVNCADVTVFEVRTTRGAVLERANNTDGVFSLWQPTPKPPPKFESDILFVARGEPVNLTCPGISLRNMPVSWRVGTKFLNPRTVDRESNKRVHLNARDQIVFATVIYSDANLYSTMFLNPRTVDRENNERVHLNARDEIVVATVKYSHVNYCWQRDALLGTVRLEVWEGSHLRWNHHVLLLLMLFVAAFMLRAIDRVVGDKRRRLGML